jgi:two-component system CheB/CheR fusion protein
MEVTAAQNGTLIESGHVYVIPPGQRFGCPGRELRESTDGSRFQPIDHLFRSLAERQAERTAALLFAGVRSDGTVGATEMKAAGALVIVQAPVNAAEAGLTEQQLLAKAADLVLPQPRVLTALADYFKPTRRRPDGATLFDANALAPIFLLLAEATGHDFSCYKHATVSRRIQRRMRVHGLEDPAHYVELLKGRTTEANLLFNEMLIGVTSFFRDPETYSALEKAIDEYLTRRRPGQDLRVWVPACSTGEEAYSTGEEAYSTGEEAYSIAILIDECLHRANKSHSLKIFATDVDAKAIDFARAGRYPRGIAAYVSPERLERYFVHEDDTYRINKETRERIVLRRTT